MTHSPDITLSPQAIQWIDHLDRTQKYDLDLIRRACAFASEYDTIETPFGISTLTQGLEMASNLITLKCDSTAIACAILYPTILYRETVKEKFYKTFDYTVYKIVLGATKIETIHQIRAQGNQIERLRKMLLAMVDDIRTILLKLVERLFLLKHSDKTAQEKLAQ
jgi:(p)ppGpp synthase/HD superfamily hydrolase